MDGVSVKVRIAGGICHHGGVDVAHGFAHGAHQALFALVGVKVQQGADALGNRAGRHDDDLFLREGDALFCGHDDVLVVREDKNGGSRRVLHGLQDVVGGGVHGLAAGDDVVDTEFKKQVCHSLTGTDGDNAVVLFRIGDVFLVIGSRIVLLLFELFFDFFEIVGSLGFLAGLELLCLGDHVLNLGKLQRAVLLAFVQGVAGHVGMNVDLEDLVVIADDERVADAGQIFAKRVEVDVGTALAYHVDGVKGKGDGLHQDIAGTGKEIGLGIIPITLFTRNHFAPQGGQNGFEDDHVALAAGVDHTGLLQNGVLIDGIFEGEVSGVDTGDERVFQGSAFVGRLGSGFGRKA